MKKNLKKILIGVIIVVLVGGFVWFKKNQGIEAEKITVEKGDILETVEGDGVVKSHQSTKIYALGNKNFQIDKVLVEVGDKVKKGDVIFTTKNGVDNGAITSVESQIQGLKAEYQEAKDYAEKMKKLNKEGVVSDIEKNQAETAVQVLRNQINSLSGNRSTVLENSMPEKVLAPYDGEVVALQICEGEEIMPGKELAEVAVTDDIYIEVCLAPKDAKEITEKSEAYFKGNKSELLGIQKIHPKVENRISDVGIMEKKVVVDINIGEDIKQKRNMIIGMEEDIKFVVNQQKNVLVVPKRAVFTTIDGEIVYKLEDNKAFKTEIVTGNKDKRKVEVIKGLKEGDIVVIPPEENMADGTKIK